MQKIPKTMSTQHPDNIRAPFFASGSVIEGDDEIKEAFYSYSHLGCKEQLWDCEGKEADTHVVRKLITRHGDFFAKQRLGKDIFLTLRVPNPEVEKSEAKILLEALESIPRNFDISRAAYGDDVAPIFEVSLPMATSARSLSRIREYYRRFVSGKGKVSLMDDDISMEKWVGRFMPEEISMIPLFETMDNILQAHETVREYAEKEKLGAVRVWLARSDPALNYGFLSAVLINKIALQRLASLDVKTFPILGCGSAPFRGNLRPDNLNCLKGYPSVETFTVQSAFKYDHEERDVVRAVEKINSHQVSGPAQVNEEEALDIVEKTSSEYMLQVSLLAPLINDFARHIPQRRRRKLHIGLFGYSRSSGALTLPRAITFCASLYSLGLPPEILGLSVLSPKDIGVLAGCYANFETDLKDALKYVNKDNFGILPIPREKGRREGYRDFDFEIDEQHKAVTDAIADDYAKKSPSLQENIIAAGAIRGFLG